MTPDPSSREPSGVDAASLIADAARGRLPTWTVAGKRRRRHMSRVAELLDEWGRALGLDDRDRERWRAAGHLHDALRESPPAELRPQVPQGQRSLPGPLLHGPAAAERLRSEGVDDEDLLRAIAFHTIGHPELDRLGRALFCADYLEPGRPDRTGWKEKRRARFPERPDTVTFEVLRQRLKGILGDGRPLSEETVAFWNRMIGETGERSERTLRGESRPDVKHAERAEVSNRLEGK